MAELQLENEVSMIACPFRITSLILSLAIVATGQSQAGATAQSTTTGSTRVDQSGHKDDVGCDKLEKLYAEKKLKLKRLDEPGPGVAYEVTVPHGSPSPCTYLKHAQCTLKKSTPQGDTYVLRCPYFPCTFMQEIK